MGTCNWKLELEQYFDKKLQQTPHAYRLLHSLTIRVDGTDIQLLKNSLVTFPQEDVACVRESLPALEKYRIHVPSISLITVTD